MLQLFSGKIKGKLSKCITKTDTTSFAKIKQNKTAPLNLSKLSVLTGQSEPNAN